MFSKLLLANIMIYVALCRASHRNRDDSSTSQGRNTRQKKSVQSSNEQLYDSHRGSEYYHQPGPSTSRGSTSTSNNAEEEIEDLNWADYLNLDDWQGDINQYQSDDLEYNPVQVTQDAHEKQKGVLREEDVEDFIRENQEPNNAAKPIPEQDSKQHKFISVASPKYCIICYTRVKKNQYEGNPRLLKIAGKCDQCNISFCKDCFKMLHGPNKTFNTDQCPLCYKNVGNTIDMWLEHAKTCKEVYRPENDKSYKFVCAKCTYNHPYSSEMKRHLRIHLDVKPYKCPHCILLERRFTHVSNLRSHMINQHPQYYPSDPLVGKPDNEFSSRHT